MAGPTNSLAQYLQELGKKWSDARKKNLEPAWNRNFKMIKGEDPFPEFKKDDGGKTKGKEWMANFVINITRVKIFSVLGMLVDILLPDSRLPFTLELDEADLEGLGDEERKEAENARDKMRKEIRKQLSLRKADRQAKKKLLSLLYYGICWSKYNIKQIKKKGYQQANINPNIYYLDPSYAPQAEWKPYTKTVNVPGHDFRSVWSIFWDMEVDFDKLEEGQGVFEQQMICTYELKQKAKKRGYIPDAVQKVIGEWEKEKLPQDTATLRPGEREIAHRTRNIVNREWWVRIPKGLVDQFEKEELGSVRKGEESTINLGYTEKETGDEVHLLVETANDEIIKYSRRKDSKIPLKMNIWEENIDEPNNPARAIPDNMVDVQQLMTGLYRGLIDNLKLAANVIVALKRKFLQDPSQIEGGIYPGLEIDISDDCKSASDAIQQVVLQDVGGSYINGIGLTDRLKDLLSMVPEILQGFVLPKHKADTAYEVSQMMENAGKYVGQGIRNYDDYMIEPEIEDIYDFNMMDPDFDPVAKGNYRCVPGGFINYKNRILTIQQLEKLVTIVLSHELLAKEAKFRPYLEEIHRNMGFEPDKFLKSEEEKKKESEENARIQEEARAKAIQDLYTQTAIETESKIAIEDAKADRKAEGEEDNFQRDMVKQIGAGGTI